MNKDILFKDNADYILLNLPGHVYWKDKNGIFLGCNLLQAKSLGYNHPKEIIGKTDFDFALKEDAEFIRKIDLRVINEKRELLVEEPIYNKHTKKTVYYLSKKSPIMDNDGNVLGIMGVSLKTKPQASEIEEVIAKNNQNEITLVTIISLLPGNVYWKDKHGVFLGCNQQQAEVIGFKSPKDVIGKTAFDTLPHKQAEEITRIDKQIMESGNAISKEEISDSIYSKGSVYLSMKVPLKNNKNEVIGLLGVSLDITERKKLEQELIKAKEAAEAGVRSRTEFIGNMSHDIRTSLTGIIGISEFLIDELPKPDDKQKVEEDIHHCGNQLLGLLNSILEVSSLDSNENEVVCKPFDLYQLIDDLCQLEKPAVLSRNLQLNTTIDKRVPRYLVGDKMKIHRILLNLVGNGIKFTEKGSISIGARLLNQEADKATIEFSVADTGIGIPKESHSQIFERFYKATPSWKGKFTGNGIGLHIVNKFISLLGGKIAFESKPGEGTRFYFSLTMPLGEETQNHDADYDSLLTEEKRFIEPQQATDCAAIPSKNAESRPKILIIEDFAMALKTLKLLLSRFDVSVSEAMTAELGLEIIQKDYPFDLIITDIGLPGISGDEMVRLVRIYEKERGLKRQKIVALTGHATDGEFGQKCKESGIDKIYKKPMDNATLKALIDPLLLEKNQQETSESQDQKPPVSGGKLGLDLPDTEEELFEINKHPLFDAEAGEKILGSREIVFEIMKDFNQSTLGEDLERVKKAHEEGDWETVEKLTHKIKGGSGYGTVRLHYALLYMERYLKAGHKNCAEKLYHQMLRVIEETTEYLDKNL